MANCPSLLYDRTGFGGGRVKCDLAERGADLCSLVVDIVELTTFDICKLVRDDSALCALCTLPGDTLSGVRAQAALSAHFLFDSLAMTDSLM